MSDDLRFCFGFGLMAVILFGTIGYGFWALIKGDPATALAAVVLVWFGGRLLPRPIAWLSMLGARR